MLPYINTPFEGVAKLLGASVDELKLIFLFLLSYPLSGILKRIPDRNPWQKNLFIIGSALFYLVGLFDLWGGLWTILLSAGLGYGVATFIEGPLMPWVGFVVLMGHMSVSHIYRQIENNPSSVDVSGAQMVLVMKLTAFCWNVHDGRLPESELSDFQKERAIRQLPNLLDYLGYVLFFPSLMAGPAFDYVEYTKYISTAMFDLPAGTDPAKAPPTRKKRRIPRSGTPAMIKAVTGIVWIVAFLQLGGIYTADFMLSEEFLKYSFLRRVWVIHMFGFMNRTKYYGVWSLTEGACILSGIGYAGLDLATGKAKWDRLVNVKPMELELAQNTRGYLAAWNINTNHWLRNYVYLRVTPKGKKPGFRASMATFVTSAVWHGFYPGYYYAFVLASLVQTVAKNGRRYLRPFFLSPDAKQSPLPTKRFYDVFTWFVTQVSFSFIVIPFILLHTAPSFAIWRRVYFYLLISVAVSFGFFQSPARGFLSAQLKRRVTRPEYLRQTSDGGEGEVLFGVPLDAEKELQEIVNEVRAEIERRKKEGLAVPDIRTLVREKLNEVRSENRFKAPDDVGKKVS